MQKNLSSFDRVTRLFLGMFAVIAAAILFVDPFARLFALSFGLYALWECASGKCPLHAALGGRAPNEPLKSAALSLLGLGAIQTALAYEWAAGGWGKIMDPDFVSGLDKTLGYFASKNPFPWCKAFLLGAATDFSYLLGPAVAWGELAAGLGLFVAVVGILVGRNEKERRAARVLAAAALAGGMLMNAVFYFAAGWTGPGTKGSNVVMFWTQAALAYVWLASLRSDAGTRLETKQ